MTSYSPEMHQLATEPRFNTDPRTLFVSGKIPSDYKVLNDTAVQAPAFTPPVVPASGIATLTVTAAGTGLSNGAHKGVATTATKGAGTGATVDLTVAAGAVTTATVAAKGSGYAVNDTLSVTGYAGVVLTVASLG